MPAKFTCANTDLFIIIFNLLGKQLLSLRKLYMPDYKMTKWKWPEELDALVADPAHHRLLFENDLVRVLDTFIPPGHVTEIHTHKWPSSLYILKWSDFIRYDMEGNIILDSRNLNMVPLPETSIWSEPLIPHALRNIGSSDIHIISVEIK